MPPASPDPPAYSRPDRTLRSQSQPIMRQASQLRRDDVLHMLQHAPAAPPQSLNKYKVLPSIERRRSEVGSGESLGQLMSKFGLCDDDDAILQQSQRREEPDVPAVMDERADVDLRPQPPDPGPSKEAGSLLLAVRAPCGRRFQRHFDPSDTLLTVRASAEARYGAKYGDASIETMDVPRRTFTDMDMTLDRCGILNRSLLVISLNDSVMEHS